MQVSQSTRFYQTIIKYSFYLLFILVPLLLTPWNYELFEYNKMMAVYLLTAAIGSAWVATMTLEKQIRIRRTVLDLPILLFAGSQLVSTIFSIDPHVSWLGYYSRFNGGMWSILCYTVLYFAFTSHAELFVPKSPEVKPAKAKQPPAAPLSFSLPPLVVASIISASFVAIYGVLERLGIDKDIWVQDVQNRVFSTLGQPNWLAAYIVALTPATIALTTLHRKSWSLAKILWGTASILLFCVLLFTRSRSGLFGLAIADLIWCTLTLLPVWKNPVERKMKSIPILFIHLIFVAIVFINGTGTPAIDKYVTFQGIQNLVSQKTASQPVIDTTKSTGPALEVGGTESAVIRKYVWQGAIAAWRSTTKTMLIGTGTETFAFAFYQHRPEGHNLTSEWDFLYNKAHNEYLNFLATTGILGLSTYLLFIGAFIWWYLASLLYAIKKNTHNSDLLVLTTAIFAGWVSLLVTNFFGFSVVIGQIFFFLFPALCIVLLESKEQTKELKVALSDTPAFLTFLPVTFQTKSLAIVRAIVVLIGISGIVMACVYWYADVLYAQGYHLGRSGSGASAVQYISQAIALNPREPLYHDELSGNYAALSLAAFQNKQATEAAQLSQLALTESNKALSTSPKNVNFWKTRTKIFYTLSSIDPALNDSALEALKQASLLSPNDPKIYYNLAILTGRTGNTDAAVAYLLKAKELKKNYRDVYFALYVFYGEMKKPVEAKSILLEYVTKIDAQDKDFQDRINKF